MKEILSIISALNLMLMPVTPATDAAQTQKDIAVEPTYESAINTQIYLQGLFYELPKEEEPQSIQESASQVLASIAEVVPSAPAVTAVAEPKKTLLGNYRLTGYCPCQKCCGKSKSNPSYGITASGARAAEGVTIAMAGLPFGTRVYIEGLGERIVQDRGVSQNIIDVFVSSHGRCFERLYNRTAQVWIIED